MRMASLVHSRETGELFEQPTKEYGELLGLLLAYSLLGKQGKCWLGLVGKEGSKA